MTTEFSDNFVHLFFNEANQICNLRIHPNTSQQSRNVNRTFFSKRLLKNLLKSLTMCFLFTVTLKYVQHTYVQTQRYTNRSHY